MTKYYDIDGNPFTRREMREIEDELVAGMRNKHRKPLEETDDEEFPNFVEWYYKNPALGKRRYEPRLPKFMEM